MNSSTIGAATASENMPSLTLTSHSAVGRVKPFHLPDAQEEKTPPTVHHNLDGFTKTVSTASVLDVMIFVLVFQST